LTFAKQKLTFTGKPGNVWNHLKCILYTNYQHHYNLINIAKEHQTKVH